MALPTNNSRPAVPYQPTQVLPNYNRYEVLGQFPPTAQQLDGDLNRIIDLINTQAAEINGIVVGALPGANDPLNTNHLMQTDGNGNISWTLVNAVNLDLASVDTDNIVDAAITPAKIQPQAIGSDQLATNAVTNAKILDGAVGTSKLLDLSVTTLKLADSAVTTAKLQDNSVTAAKIPDRELALTKLAMPTSNSIVVGRTNFGNSFLELPMGNWQVPTFNGTSGIMTSEDLSTVFNNSVDNTFFGRKLSDASLAGSKLMDASVDGGKLIDASVSGAKLTDASVPTTKLMGASQFVPFAMGYCTSDGLLVKGVNVSVSKTSTGLYAVQFTSQANDTNYIVLVTAENPGSSTIFTAELSYNTRSTAGFSVRTGFNTDIRDLSFNFLVYAF